MHASTARPTIAHELGEFIEQNGRWTAHNIDLGDGVTTRGERPIAESYGIRRVVQVVADHARKPLDQLRVLDLGCGEGMYGIEFASHGARVVAIDGRAANIEKVRFVRDRLGLEKMELHVDDARNLSEAKYGRFDVVLCIGLLYHLEEEGVMNLLRSMALVCDDLCLIHTFVSTAPAMSFEWEGRTYSGRRFLEHVGNEDRERALWASLDNVWSFWPTRPSMFNALADVGFTSVVACCNPSVSWQPSDNVTLIARRGTKVRTLVDPRMDTEPEWRRPERMRRLVAPGQMRFYTPLRWIASRTPRRVKDAVKIPLRGIVSKWLYWATPYEGHQK